MSNVGTAATAGTITVRDTLPHALRYVSGTGQGWTFSPNGVVVTATNPGPVVAGDSAEFALTVDVLMAAVPAVTNSATVFVDGDTNPANDRDVDPTTVIGVPDLAIDKRHTTPFMVGQSGVYALIVTNVGAAPTVGTITVRDTLPTGLTFGGAAGTGWTVSNDGQVVTVDYPAALVTGDSATFALTVSVDASAFPSVTNSAAVTTAGDVNAANDRDSDPTGVAGVTGSPDLTLAKRHTTAFAVGQIGVYALVVTNVGTTTTVGTITVTDTLPSGLVYSSVVGTGWLASAVGSQITAQFPGVLAPGDSAQFALSVNVLPTAPPVVTNRASVAGGGDVTPANNRAVDPTVVNGVANLTIDKRHTAAFVVGEIGAYAIVVTNVGAAPTVGTITVSDTLPAGLTFASAGGTGWTVSNNGQVVTADYPAALVTGDSTNFALAVNVLPTARPAVTNYASVAGGGDLTPANDRDGDPTTVGPASDLAIDKRHVAAFVGGQSGTYTIVVTNVGVAPTVGTIVVRDTLPFGLTFAAAAGTGWTVQSFGHLVTATFPGAITPGDSAGFGIVVNVGTEAIPAVTNTATVYVAGDANPANNRDVDRTTVDRPTPVLVELFRVVTTDDGVLVEWKLGGDGSVATVAPERASFIVGPWARVSGSIEDSQGVRSVVDREVSGMGTVWYRLAGLRRDGEPFTSTAISVTPSQSAGRFALEPLAPNPSPGVSLLRFSVASRAHVRISIVDIQGREVSRLADGVRDRGEYIERLDASDLRSGLYFVRLQAPGVELHRVFILVR